MTRPVPDSSTTGRVNMSDDGDECSLCGGCGEVDATSATTPVPETVGCPLCIAVEKEERIAELERQLAEAESRIADLEAAAQDRFRGEWKTRVGNPFFKAAKAAADERMVALKLEARSNLAHAEDAERQLADMRAALGSAFTGLQNVGEHNSMTRAALADVKAALAQEPANQPLSGLIRDKDGRVRGMR
jgi:chaperonin cofactor prefoldin